MNVFTRPRLSERLYAAMKSQLALIVAPAGWGKTTLLCTWHAEARLSVWPLAWVSLDTGDNDLIRFWTYVLAALHTVHPGVGEIALAQMYASSSPPIEDVLTTLLNALSQLPTETLLVTHHYRPLAAQPIHPEFLHVEAHLP